MAWWQRHERPKQHHVNHRLWVTCDGVSQMARGDTRLHRPWVAQTVVAIPGAWDSNGQFKPKQVKFKPQQVKFKPQ
jgi:hypothetical protein